MEHDRRGTDGAGSVQGILEHFPGTELQNLAGGDSQGVTGTGIAPLPGFAGFHRKGAETREGQLGVFDKSVFNRGQKSVEGAFGGVLGGALVMLALAAIFSTRSAFVISISS